MELPRRARGDELLKSGELRALRQRLRRIAPAHDLASVIACAFDHRTRMLPFIFADTHMAPAGVRAIGSAMVDSGFTKTRIVLQQCAGGPVATLNLLADGLLPYTRINGSTFPGRMSAEAPVTTLCPTASPSGATM